MLFQVRLSKPQTNQLAFNSKSSTCKEEEESYLPSDRDEMELHHNVWDISHPENSCMVFHRRG